jgi:hypothetical protein
VSTAAIANKSLAVFLVNPEVRAILCSYEGLTPEGNVHPGTKPMLFKTLDKSISKGDICVVPTNGENRLGFTTVQVAEVDLEIDYDSRTEVRWIVSKVDVSEFKRVLDRETQFMDAVAKADKRRRADELRKSLLANMPEEEIKALPVIDVSPSSEPTG